jgi:radical SAM superfamily enzyme YgiQ (UPF0313 family)
MSYEGNLKTKMRVEDKLRVLLLYPELPESFWTLREICTFQRRKALLPPLSLLTVAALLPREWELRLVDLNTRGLTALDWDWANLVMVTGMFAQRGHLLALVREAKQRGKTVVAGGPYPTAVPEEMLAAGVDFVVLGEGENTIKFLVTALREGRPRGVFQENDRPDLTLSPIPRFDLVQFKDYRVMGIQASRGCPYNCEFCDIVNLFGRKPRYKTPDQVINELDALYRLGWRDTVFISDDNFIGHRDHARGILLRLIPWMKKSGEPFGFWTQASVNLGQDLEMMDLMTAANFGNVFLGVETPDEMVLARSRKYQNINIPLGESVTAIGTNGLTLMASFIIGFDHEKRGTGQRICDFADKHNIPLVMLNTLMALPNTCLWDRLKQEGRLVDRKIAMEGEQLNYIPTRPEAEILDEYASAVDYLFEPARFLARTYRYFRGMRPTRRALTHGPRKMPLVQIRKERPSPRDILEKVDHAARIIWRHGIRAAHRGQFWSQLVGIYRHNPSRLRKYLICLGMGESLFRLREQVIKSKSAGR